jgi:hypothetical protein
MRFAGRHRKIAEGVNCHRFEEIMFNISGWLVAFICLRSSLSVQVERAMTTP